VCGHEASGRPAPDVPTRPDGEHPMVATRL